MKMSDECVKRMVSAVEHTLSGNGPASLTLFQPATAEPTVVVFVIPAPVGVLVDTFLNDLYMMLGWSVQSDRPTEAN